MSSRVFSDDKLPLTRRHFMNRGAMGFGSLALAGVMQKDQSSAAPWAPKPTHFAPKAKSVIFFYMDGGVSHVDSFDPKPLLAKENESLSTFEAASALQV